MINKEAPEGEQPSETVEYQIRENPQNLAAPESDFEEGVISDGLDNGQELEVDPDRGEEPGGQDVITIKRSYFYSAIVPVAFVLGLGVGYLFWGRSTPPAASPQAANPPAQSNPAAAPADGSSQNPTGNEVTRYDVPVDDDYVLGPADAPITIIEFSDFECPFCAKWHAEVFKQLIASYPNQIRFVYRDFPLTNIHPEAFPAAEAANCAGEQGLYYEFHDRLFSNQYGLGSDAYELYAQELNLDLTAFQECVQSRRQQGEVQADFDYAAGLGVRSTPTFFINGIPLVGAQPYEVFSQVIDQELAGLIP